jgi:hypothetical protein
MRRPLILEFRLLFYSILGVIIPFGALLYFFPGGTDTYWTWPIPEPRSAMLIGAAYLGAILYYVAALHQNDWQQMENGLGGLIIFSLVLLAATMVHWDAFKPYHPITLVWLAFYYGGPFLVPIFYRLQIDRMGVADDEGVKLAPAVRAWLIGRGVFYGLLTLLGFTFANAIAAGWPWSIQPLEVRVFVGQIALVSWGGLIAMRRRWAWPWHRLGVLSAGAIGALQLVGLLTGPTAYQVSSPLGAVLPVMFAEWLTVAVVLFVLYRRR